MILTKQNSQICLKIRSFGHILAIPDQLVPCLTKKGEPWRFPYRKVSTLIVPSTKIAVFSSTCPFPVMLDQILAHIDPFYAMYVTKISRNLVPRWFQDMVVPTCFQSPINFFGQIKTFMPQKDKFGQIFALAANLG